MIKKSLFLLCGLLFVPVGISSGQNFDTTYGSGVHQYFNGQTNAAIQSFDAAIMQNAQDPRPYYFRGLAQQRCGNSYAAQADFQMGAQMEAATKRRSTLVSRALERIQGGDRYAIEQARTSAFNPGTEFVQQAPNYPNYGVANYGYVPNNYVPNSYGQYNYVPSGVVYNQPVVIYPEANYGQVVYPQGTTVYEGTIVSSPKISQGIQSVENSIPTPIASAPFGLNSTELTAPGIDQVAPAESTTTSFASPTPTPTQNPIPSLTTERLRADGDIPSLNLNEDAAALVVTPESNDFSGKVQPADNSVNPSAVPAPKTEVQPAIPVLNNPFGNEQSNPPASQPATGNDPFGLGSNIEAPATPVISEPTTPEPPAVDNDAPFDDSTPPLENEPASGGNTDGESTSGESTSGEATSGDATSGDATSDESTGEGSNVDDDPFGN